MGSLDRTTRAIWIAFRLQHVAPESGEFFTQENLRKALALAQPAERAAVPRAGQYLLLIPHHDLGERAITEGRSEVFGYRSER